MRLAKERGKYGLILGCLIFACISLIYNILTAFFIFPLFRHNLGLYSPGFQGRPDLPTPQQLATFYEVCQHQLLLLSLVGILLGVIYGGSASFFWTGHLEITRRSRTFGVLLGVINGASIGALLLPIQARWQMSQFAILIFAYPPDRYWGIGLLLNDGFISLELCYFYILGGAFIISVFLSRGLRLQSKTAVFYQLGRR